MRKSYCIICTKEKKGIAVENDFVLESVRWFKRNVTHNEKNNMLVVCRQDYQKYKGERAKYESRQRLYLALGVIFFLLVIARSPTLMTVIIALLVLLLFYFFSLMSYRPRINIKNQHTK